MCRNLNWFSNFEKFERTVRCQVGDGHNVDVLGVGDVDVISQVNGHEIKGCLKDVLHIPQLATNLYSIESSAMQELVSVFYENSCKIMKKGKEVMVGR